MSYTTILFARSSFLEGIARIFDFGNALQEYNASPTPEMADYLALLGDWHAVGEDMETAINNVGQKLLSDKYEPGK